MSKNDGGPAFPVAAGPRDGYGNPSNPPQRGMTLRDYFAGQCIVAAMNTLTYDEGHNFPTIARSAYALADAMIAERAR